MESKRNEMKRTAMGDRIVHSTRFAFALKLFTHYLQEADEEWPTMALEQTRSSGLPGGMSYTQTEAAAHCYFNSLSNHNMLSTF